MESKHHCSHHHIGLALLIIRLVTGGIFLYHGILKLTNMGGATAFFASMGLSVAVAWIIALVETIGGALLVVGLFTRWTAIPLGIIMLGAIIMVKSKVGGIGPMEAEIMLLAACLSIALAGSGKYSLFKKGSCDGTCDGCESGKCCVK
jgi:uncharacterized membrane protein YphA (DoxX/SURF4 family)